MRMPSSKSFLVYLVLGSSVLGAVGVLSVKLLGPTLKMAQNALTEPGRASLGQLGCLSCHALAGQGGSLAPPLGSELAAKGEPWIHDYLTSGKHIDVYPRNGHLAFTKLNSEQAQLLAAYLSGLSITSRYTGAGR